MCRRPAERDRRAQIAARSSQQGAFAPSLPLSAIHPLLVQVIESERGHLNFALEKLGMRRLELLESISSSQVQQQDLQCVDSFAFAEREPFVTEALFVVFGSTLCFLSED